jgi:hypothetical protein
MSNQIGEGIMKETLSRRLDELVNSVLDMDYTKSIPVQCREMDIHYQTFMKYYKGISECNAANLIKIAVYYNVSVDYLLGRTNVKNWIWIYPAAASSQAYRKRQLKKSFVYRQTMYQRMAYAQMMF